MKTLRQLRKEAGVSQDTLAKQLATIRGGGAYQGPISNIESGKVSPTVKRLADYLEALGYKLQVTAIRFLNPEGRGGEGVKTEIIALESLLGNIPRAKDTHGEDLKGFESSSKLDFPPVQDANLTIQQIESDEKLESLLLTILNK
jgi:transcriptional regulator with XRE-family HTH domain